MIDIVTIDIVIRFILQLGLSGALLYALVYYFSRYTKVILKMKTSKDSYKLGDEIRGSLELLLKRRIISRAIKIEIRGVGTIGGKNNNQEDKIFFQKEYILDGTGQYLTGANPIFNFNIEIPDLLDLNPQGRKIMKNGKEINNFMNEYHEISTGGFYAWSITAKLNYNGAKASTGKALSISI